MNSAAVAVLLCTMAFPGFAQWLNYPTPGVPRTRDGKPNLTAPVPRTRDSKPDLSGIWKIAYPKKALARSAKESVGPNLIDFMPDGVEIPLLPEGAALFK